MRVDAKLPGTGEDDEVSPSVYSLAVVAGRLGRPATANRASRKCDDTGGYKREAGRLEKIKTHTTCRGFAREPNNRVTLGSGKEPHGVRSGRQTRTSRSRSRQMRQPTQRVDGVRSS